MLYRKNFIVSFRDTRTYQTYKYMWSVGKMEDILKLRLVVHTLTARL